MGNEVLAVRLHRNVHGALVLSMEGVEHAGVVPVRAFPIAAPDEGLSLMGADGHELLWLERLSQLDERSRALVQEELAVREFVPTITAITKASSLATPSVWSVMTDRGPTQLTLKAEEDIRRLAGRTRLLIAASDGVHFSIPDTGALDKASRRILDRFL